jgi:hypothetical protein
LPPSNNARTKEPVDSQDLFFTGRVCLPRPVDPSNHMVDIRCASIVHFASTQRAIMAKIQPHLIKSPVAVSKKPCVLPWLTHRDINVNESQKTVDDNLSTLPKWRRRRTDVLD